MNPDKKLSSGKKWKSRIKHAFSVEQEPLDVEASLPLLDKAAGFIVRRRLEAPVIMVLQSLIPLNFIGSQLLVVIGPYLDPFLSKKDQDKIVQILEHREGLDLFMSRIELKSKDAGNGKSNKDS